MNRMSELEDIYSKINEKKLKIVELCGRGLKEEHAANSWNAMKHQIWDLTIEIEKLYSKQLQVRLKNDC